MPDIVERLRSFDGGEFPVVSLYLGLDVDPREARTVSARLKELLDPLLRTARGPRDAQASLRADVERILGMESSITDRLGRSVVVFACNGQGLFELFSLPVQIEDVAQVGPRPYLRPLDAALHGVARTCAVLVDKRDARFYELTLAGIEELTRVTDEGVRIDNYAGRYGLDEHNARNHAGEVTHRHYRDIATALRSLHNARQFDLVLLGGRAGIADEFLPFLSNGLRELVGGTFVIDPHTATPAQVGERCAPLLAEQRLVRQHAVVKEVVENAHRFDTALGLRAVLEAVNASAIDVLVLDRTVSVRGVSCPSCGWLGLNGGRCPTCEHDLVIHADVLDELARRTVERGGTVEHVATGHEIGNDGVVAKLRFPLDLPVG